MPTVASLKQLFQAQIAPSDDSEFLRILQEADIRALAYGKWHWTRSRITVAVTAGYITLPATHCAVLGAQIDGYPSDITGEEFEFVVGGMGEIDVTGPGYVRLIDQGLNGAELRVYKVTGDIDEGTSVVLLAHKAPQVLYDPDIADSDTPDDAVASTICPDVAALKNFCLGIVMEEAGELTKSREHFAIALSTLDNKEKTQRGHARAQVNIRPRGVGISRIRTFR